MYKKLFKLILSLSLAFVTTANVAMAQASMKVSGTVVDAQGPVIGAAVMEKGTSNGVVTDIDGKYEISVGGVMPL